LWSRGNKETLREREERPFAIAGAVWQTTGAQSSAFRDDAMGKQLAA